VEKRQMPVRTVSVARLKVRLSEYLSMTKAGEEVIVTERGRPVARLLPVSRDLPPSLEEMARIGLVRLPTRRLPRKFWKTLPNAADPSRSVLRALLEERAQGR
jgi:prevent-host-death family protein